MTGTKRLALRLSLVGVLAASVVAEANAQWGWTTPSPQAQSPASAQPPQGGSRGENFSAGKTGAQLFASDCTGAGCHKGPQGLARDRGAGSLASFLREHYTNSRESATAIAAYLVSLPAATRGDPKQQPRGAAARPDDAAKPPERRPPAAAPAPAAATPSGETSDPTKPAAARAQQQQQRGRQATTAPPPSAAPAATPAPAPAAAPAPEPVVAPPAPEPPKPQWDIFD